jgi:signal transduction histidine kinase
VHVERLIADRAVYDVTQPVHLPALLRDLQVDYTALSLVAPEKTQFRYKLEGRNPEWQEAGNRRSAFYTDLPPGRYRFRVIASNNSGLWNEQGDALDFSIAPAYWQTYWFRAVCVLALVGLLWFLYQLRLRQVTQALGMTLGARISERTRVARELHDTLLQSFQGLLLQFRTAQTLIPTRPAQAQQTLEAAIDQAREAVNEGRRAVEGLRPAALEANDFTEAIRTLGEELANYPIHSTVELTLNVEGTPRALEPFARDEIYRIAAESIRNAYKHAEASRVEVLLGYGDRRFDLRVRDDGKGIDPAFLSENIVEGHYGIIGMRERAKELGSNLSIWSAPTSGTELVLSVPGVTAYGRGWKVRNSWLAGRFSAIRVHRNS